MVKNRKKQTKTALLLSLAFMVIIAGAFAFTVLAQDNPLSQLVAAFSGEHSTAQEEPDTPPEIADEPDAPLEPVVHNIPDFMRAVTLMPGEDFLTEDNEAAADVQKEIDEALAAAKKLTMNTVIVGTSTEKWAAYTSATRPTPVAVFDPLEYIIRAAREQGLYVYCTFDLKATYDGRGLITYPCFDTALLDSVTKELTDFVQRYAPDGIFFTNYDFPKEGTSFADYLRCGAGMGYEQYLDHASHSLVRLASSLVRQKAPNIQVGLITEPQWATEKEDEAGNTTLDTYSMLTDGHCDVKAFLEEGFADMIAVKAYGSLTDPRIPFQKVVKWWSSLAEENEVRMYAIHAADRMANSSYTGWGTSDQMTKQAITLEDYSGCSGSVFYGLSSMKKDPAGAVTLLLKYFNHEVNSKFIMTELSVSTPGKLVYSTYEPSVLFRGASDPTNPLTINGKNITTDSNGYFSVSYELKPGLNTFTISHKEKTLTYKITRNVKIFQSVAPTGSLTVDGNTEVTLTAMAYEDAAISATIAGQTIPLTRDNSVDDSTDSDSFYVKYTGIYRTPAATTSVRNLGSITFNGTWESIKESAAGASISVNKIATVADGSPVVVTASQAETFPPNTLDDLSDGNYYPLPKGALDYTVGDQIVFTSGGVTYRYYKLASGLRVYASDISTTAQKVANVTVEGMSITANSSTTTVMLNMSQPTSYSVSYNSSGISFHFNYLKSACGSMSTLTKNPIFSSATWSGDTLTLRFRKANGMCGYTASYSGNTLSLKFNNPPSGVAGARIVVDPGHGGIDCGALGFYPGKHEDFVNRQIGTELASILRSRGAAVLLIQTDVSSGKVTIQNRAVQAAAFQPQIFLSVHSNSSTSSSAYGSEAYYFYDFSRPFAQYIDSALYTAMGNRDRGAKYGLYYVTRWTQYTSVLAECGFMSNNTEYVQLLSNYQTIAGSLANGIANYINTIYSGSTATGTESVGKVSQIPVTGVSLDKSSLAMKVGEKFTLQAAVAPENATNAEVTWSSDKTDVLTVDQNGTLTAVAPGTAKVTVKTADGEKTAVCTVTVTAVEATGVTLNIAEQSIKVGESVTLSAAVAPENATDKAVTWQSSDVTVATVDATGKVIAVKAGTAAITAKTANGKTATCTVTVTAATVEATGVTLNKTALTLTEGGAETLTATVAPENATDKTVAWQSSDAAVATVDAAGKVTAVAAGTATITAGTANGKNAACTVTVTAAAVEVTGVTLDQTSLNLAVGGAATLTATVAPDNATDKSVTWQSSNAAVVSASGGTVTAVAAGEATITATCGGKTASCVVTVTAAG